VTAAEREQRLHDLTSHEEHMVARWLCDHQPAVFDRAADYVEAIRRMDTDHIRKEARS
jgi:hypothetical protein